MASAVRRTPGRPIPWNGPLPRSTSTATGPGPFPRSAVGPMTTARPMRTGSISWQARITYHRPCRCRKGRRNSIIDPRSWIWNKIYSPFHRMGFLLYFNVRFLGLLIKSTIFKGNINPNNATFMEQRTLRNNLLRSLYFVLTAALLFSCGKKEKTQYAKAEDIPVHREMVAELTSPPHVPTPVGDRKAKQVKVDMENLELAGEFTSGVRYVSWTFGGTVPGDFIRTRVGDEVQFTLKNHPDNKLPHNIDLRAVTGPGGGAESSCVAP